IRSAGMQHSKQNDRKKYPALDTSYEPRSSMEDADSSMPNSPVAPVRLAPGLTVDPSPSHSRTSSINRLHKRARLPFFHSNASREHRTHGSRDLHPDDSDSKSSRNPSGETNGHGRSSLEVKHSPDAKHIFSHKT